MSNIFDELGLDEKTFNEAEAESVQPAFEVLPSGVYGATIKSLFTFTSSKGAGMLQAVIHVTSSDRDITIYQNTKKKDGKPNDIGTRTFKSIIAAANADMSELSTKTEKVKAYGKEVDGKVVKGLDGKKIAVLVRAVFEEGAKFENYNEIEAYAKADGTNANGEDLLEEFKAKIEKTPVLNRKAKEGASTGSSSTQATTATGASVADIL